MNLPPTIKRLLLALLILPMGAVALPSDQNQPAYIEADQAAYYQKTGTTFYKGHVKVDQGTSHLLADTLTVYRDPHTNQIQQMVAKGKLAQYSTLPKPGGQVLHASAKTIQYEPNKGIVLLIGDALITQGSNSFRGQHIEYNLTKQTVISSPAANSKTKIVIQPGSLS